MYKLYRLFVFGSILLYCAYNGFSQVNFPLQSEFKYLKGSQASTLSNEWMSENFDDSNWTQGNAPFRYTDGEGGTVLYDMQYNYSTIYLRSTFIASQVNSLKQIHFNVDYDDGFVVWINNQEVCRRNAPELLSFNAFAPDFRESGIPTLIVIDSNDIAIHEGINTIAIQGFNCNLESSDFYFDIEFHALPSLPESSVVNFSHPSGFYEAPFNLTLTTSDTNTSILYTFDGSDPSTSETALNTENEINISVDPASSNNRPATPAFIVRASLTKDGFANTNPKTNSYIFIENVKTQQHPGGDWPTYNINDQDIDLEMDHEVVNNTLYSDSIDDALLDIPSISISTDLWPWAYRVRTTTPERCIFSHGSNNGLTSQGDTVVRRRSLTTRAPSGSKSLVRANAGREPPTRWRPHRRCTIPACPTLPDCASAIPWPPQTSTRTAMRIWWSGRPDRDRSARKCW